MNLKNKSIGKKLFYLFFIWGIIFYADPSPAQNLKTKSNEWLPLKNHQYVDISYTMANVTFLLREQHIENVYLKFTNKTDRVVKIEWKTENWSNGKCSGCEGGILLRIIKLYY